MFQVNTQTSSGQGAPSIASLSNDGFVITWESGLTTGSSKGHIGAQMYDASGNADGSEFRVNTVNDLQQRNPSIDSFTNGEFVITWESGDYFYVTDSTATQDGSNVGVYAQRYNANGTKNGSEY